VKNLLPLQQINHREIKLDMKALEKEVMKPLQDRIIKGLEKKDLMKKGKMQP